MTTWPGGQRRVNERSEMNVGLTDLLARVAQNMRMKYRVSMQDIEITETPGYWRDKEPRMHPGHPLHRCLGCDGPFQATYTYFDPPRVNGRFASPTRTWARLRANADLTGKQKPEEEVTNV